MPILYTVPAPTIYRRTLDAAELQLGRDVSFRGDFEVGPHRDYLVIERAAAAKQSVEREAQAAPGDLPLSPDWGFGLRRFVKMPDSKSVRDAITTRVQARLAVNPRIQTVDDVRVYRDTNTDALVTSVAATVAGRTSSGRIDDRVAATITVGGNRQ